MSDLEAFRIARAERLEQAAVARAVRVERPPLVLKKRGQQVVAVEPWYASRKAEDA